MGVTTATSDPTVSSIVTYARNVSFCTNPVNATNDFGSHIRRTISRVEKST